MARYCITSTISIDFFFKKKNNKKKNKNTLDNPSLRVSPVFTNQNVHIHYKASDIIEGKFDKDMHYKNILLKNKWYPN